jgi:hypothetical protein
MVPIGCPFRSRRLSTKNRVFWFPGISSTVAVVYLGLFTTAMMATYSYRIETCKWVPSVSSFPTYPSYCWDAIGDGISCSNGGLQTVSSVSHGSQRTSWLKSMGSLDGGRGEHMARLQFFQHPRSWELWLRPCWYTFLTRSLVVCANEIIKMWKQRSDKRDQAQRRQNVPNNTTTGMRRMVSQIEWIWLALSDMVELVVTGPNPLSIIRNLYADKINCRHVIATKMVNPESETKKKKKYRWLRSPMQLPVHGQWL